MSSFSPPLPQYVFGNPFIFMYCSGVRADTPPKKDLYGRLKERGKRKASILKAYTSPPQT